MIFHRALRLAGDRAFSRHEGSPGLVAVAVSASFVLAVGVGCATEPEATPSGSAGLAVDDGFRGPGVHATTPPALLAAVLFSEGPAALGGTTSADVDSGLLEELGPADPPPAEVPDPAQVARAQRLLAAQGYPLGGIDGVVGPATVAALRAFQGAQQLPVTGRLDRVTVDALVRSSEAVADKLPTSVVVDLSDQHLTVYNSSGQIVGGWPVSTGGPGSQTPTGVFAVFERQLVGTASGDPRVHMDFFTVFNDDIGFHGIPWVSSRDARLSTPLGLYGVSHGCIRMEDANAEFLYTFLPDGATVEVRD